jgi:alkylation response protein AidB-like acyl-CoA dehydrogenase
MADYFMTVVRTGGEGSGATGISLLCIDRHLKGVHVRKMETQVRTGCGCNRFAVLSTVTAIVTTKVPS